MFETAMMRSRSCTSPRDRKDIIAWMNSVVYCNLYQWCGLSRVPKSLVLRIATFSPVVIPKRNLFQSLQLSLSVGWTGEQHPSNREKMLVPESDRESHPIRSRLDGSVVERVTSNDKVHGSIPCRGKRVLPCVVSLFCVFCINCDLNIDDTEK